MIECTWRRIHDTRQRVLDVAVNVGTRLGYRYVDIASGRKTLSSRLTLIEGIEL